ncbi:MAG: glycosyltransferase family 2 protein [Candidatus Hydrogenedentota bacterium]|nr:MAG: glycosyltransferase family 2 protein [Candidatus Hydrogenedentota bacterium]
MSLSIIIVSYNTRDLLLAALRSVYGSSYLVEPEVIVVDNASSDGSPEAVRAQFPRCTVIANEENLGFSRANNMALKRAHGRYILLLNPDTVLEPEVLQKMENYMDNRPDVGMVSCKLITADGSLDLACRRSFPSLWDGLCRASGASGLFPKSRLFARYNLTYLDENETCEVDAVNGAFMFVRREAAEQVGLLDEDYFMYIEDLDWCYRFREAGWKIIYHPAASALHLKGKSGNQHSSAMIRELFKSTETFYRKHYFPRIGITHKVLLTQSLALWKWTTLAKNALRNTKRTRP